MLIGYARVSTLGQKLETQIEKLRVAGCRKIYQEKETGSDINRPQLNKLLNKVAPGDVVIVTSLDRLARSTGDLFQLTSRLSTLEVGFRSIREPWVDTGNQMGKFLLTIFAGLAELERDLIRTRTAEGRLLAKKRGIKFGRKFKLTPHQRSEVEKMLNDGHSMKSISILFNVGVATVHRIKKRMI
ncbi:MAG: resolvase [Blastopirellula sp.]|nr:MAG: resolvase [Blastopirellula sp.]